MSLVNDDADLRILLDALNRYTAGIDESKPVSDRDKRIQQLEDEIYDELVSRGTLYQE